MNVLSLFSGVGGFDLGLEAAGHQTVFQCEWDKHATRILERHWPDVPRWGDISTLTADHILTHAPTIDIVAWGSPCQDLSVAGKRAGLDGARSGLFHQGIRIIRELQEATNGKYPRISIWENVYGALNSNRGADFGIILNEMAAAGALVQEWRVLDAQYFGVPQRRRRVFLVSVFDPATAERCPDPLLPVSESVRGDTEEGAATRQEPAGTVAEGFGSGREPIKAFTGTSHAQYGEGVGTLRANGGDLGGGSETLITFTKSKRAQTADDNKPMMLDPTRVGDVRVYEPPVQTLQGRMGTGGNQVPMIAFSHTQGLSAQPSDVAWPTLRKEGNGHAVAYDEYNDSLGGQVHHALRAGTKQSTGVIEPTMSVRRLTPLECERLMGWPDNWTAGQADSHRYKQCGNGVASPVAEWIGQQLTQLNH